MRKALPWVLLVLVLTGGGYAGFRAHEAETERDALRTKITRIESAAEDIEGASDSLQTEVANFDYDDWKDVVPAVTDEASGVKDAVEDLKNALGEPLRGVPRRPLRRPLIRRP